MCFFLQGISRLNWKYKSLFNTTDGSDGTDERKQGTGFIEHFTKHHGRTYSTKEVATFEGLSMNDTYELSAIHVLNDMVYLKAKVQHDKELIREYNKK